jgi:hypothetical protein
MPSDALKALAPDLSTSFPRSPRESFAGYVHAGRMLDKCRAVAAGSAGEFHFNCPLDRYFFDFTGIDHQAFAAFVATGADDAAVTDWITSHSLVKDRAAVVAWNNHMRDLRLSELPTPLQLFLEDYIPKYIPAGKVVRVWFDVYDMEEGRL